MTSDDLVIDGVQLPDGRTVTLRCAGGVIVSVDSAPTEEHGVLGSRSGRDGRGFVAVPRLIDAHVHLDKTLLGPAWYPHRASSHLADRIAFELELLEGGTVEPVEIRAGRLLDLELMHGATAVQSHVDVSARLGLSRVEAVLRTRQEYAGRCDVFLVAFPQEGVLASPGTAAALAWAIKEGCDAVGGLDPAELDGDRDGQLDVVFALADRYGCRIDLHVHEAGQTGIDTLLAIAARSRALGLGGRVAVSHGYCLAQVPLDVAAATADVLAGAGVALVSSAPGQGRMPPLRLLAEHGMRVVVASDNIRDSWWPYGNADPLERACTAGYLAGAHSDAGLVESLVMVTANPAELLGLSEVTFSAGSAADFTLVRASSVQEAIVAQPAVRVVVKAGRIVAGEAHLRERPAPAGDTTAVRGASA